MTVEPPALPVGPLGRSGIEVSRLALGSWRTFERISRERGVSVMRAARDAGVTFLDDARYNDETGRAPIPSGYSEIVFGELFRAAGWPRADTIVSNKLWWEFWPSQSPREELAESLRRMGLDYLDLIYSEVPPPDVPLADAVGLITELVSSGLARSWGTLNWTPAQMDAAWELAGSAGRPGPVATQPPYSLITRQYVEDPEMARVTSERGIAIVASYTLAGGVLTGKYTADPGAGRATGQLDQPRYAAGAAAGVRLAALAAGLGCAPAQLAMAFALLNPSVTTVLFGATTPEQVTSNIGSLAVAESLSAEDVARLRAIS
jgi:aryl-alcohol dehydrogenase-like predicted oxidoreductase